MRLPLLALIAAGVCASAPLTALAQGRGGGSGGGDAPASKKDEWALPQGALPNVTAAGPCPFVKILYDAARFEEFQGGKESSSTVQYTGEIQNLRAQCAYKAAEPIHVKMNVLFSLGRGPAAEGDSKNYRYWIAVTYRNQGVIDKQYFDMPVRFGSGEERVDQSEEIGDITIPRASDKISGSNFEILVGFDVTPQMAEFNREGKRFRINATGQTTGQ